MSDVATTLSSYADLTRKLTALIDTDFPAGREIELPAHVVDQVQAAVADAFASHRTLAGRLNRLMLLDDGAAGEVVC